MSFLDKVKQQTQSTESEEKKEQPKPKIKVSKPKLKDVMQPLKPKEKKDFSKGRVFAFFGEEGTGKTFASINLAEKFGNTLYIDTEYKAEEILEEQFEHIPYDIKRPILDNDKKFSQVFNENSQFHIIVVEKIDKTTGKRDDVATTKYIMELTPKLLHFIKSGKYDCVVIDSLLPIWEYAYSEWLNRNKGRVRPSKFEWSEIEAIKQDILMPFINISKVYGVHIIMTASITGHYVNDVKIGYRQDAKAWLLHRLSYEVWCSRDYRKYMIKHPYKPYWEIQDEDMDISVYLFDKKFIEEHAEFKNFEDFKYETLTSEEFREDKKETKSSLTIGK